jgi:Protein of unknown function (DUF4242)
VKTYVVLRRRGWRTIDDLRESAKRAESAVDRTPDDIGWIRSYLLAESDGSLGTVCIYQAASPEEIRAHAARADLPVEEIVAVADTMLVRPDPADATESGEERP